MGFFHESAVKWFRGYSVAKQNFQKLQEANWKMQKKISETIPL